MGVSFSNKLSNRAGWIRHTISNFFCRPKSLISRWQRRKPFFQETPRRPLAGELDGARVGLAGLRVATQAATEVRARGVRELVFIELAIGEQSVQRFEPDLRAVAHGHRHGAIERHD